MDNLKEKRLEATRKANGLRELSDTDVQFAEWLGLSKVTMYKRIKDGSWEKRDIALIDYLHNKARFGSDLNLPKPNSQVQEVLFELITRKSIDRKFMINSCNVENLTARISDIRRKLGSTFIISNMYTCTNKFGREVKFANYSLRDKEDGINAYREMTK